MSDYQILTVEQTEGGGLALRRKNADDTISPAATPVIGTASGFPLILGDAAEGRRFQSVRIPFGPVQAGSGDPSPDNVRPISGWTQAVVTRTGVNVWDEEWEVGGLINATGAPYTTTDRIRSKNFCPCKPNTSYYKYSSDVHTNVFWYDSDKAFITRDVTTGMSAITSPSNAAFFKLVDADRASYADNISINYPATDTEYHAYVGTTYSITFPTEAGTVYGGTVDLTAGTLTVDRAYISLTGAASESWAMAGSGDVAYFRRTIGDLGSVVDDSGISSHFAPTMISGATTDVGQRVVNSTASGAAIMVIRPEDAADATLATFKAWLAEQAAANTPVQVCWKLTEPAVYQLTPVQIAALEGINTIWADCGPAEVEYIRDTGMVIEAANADTRAMIGEASGVTASRSLAVGEYVTVGAALYRVTAAVGQGETLVPGTNVVETTVGAELVRLAGMINA